MIICWPYYQSILLLKQLLQFLYFILVCDVIVCAYLDCITWCLPLFTVSDLLQWQYLYGLRCGLTIPLLFDWWQKGEEVCTNLREVVNTTASIPWLIYIALIIEVIWWTVALMTLMMNCSNNCFECSVDRSIRYMLWLYD